MLLLKLIIFLWKYNKIFPFENNQLIFLYNNSRRGGPTQIAWRINNIIIVYIYMERRGPTRRTWRIPIPLQLFSKNLPLD